MMPQMPRGAIPPRRSELAAAEPYRPDSDADIFVPSGTFPTPSHELAVARPHKASGAAPGSFLAWANDTAVWDDETASLSIWTEEAFAKACVAPKIRLSAEAVLAAARACGSSNFAQFMQTRGFQMNGASYRDGPFQSVDWTNTAILNDAIAMCGPIKIGVASTGLTTGMRGRVTPGVSGWAVHGLPAAEISDHWASLCGYGALAALVDLFAGYGVAVDAPAGMPTDECYAMVIWNSIGILDHQSLVNITGEAWVRMPTTIVQG